MTSTQTVLITALISSAVTVLVMTAGSSFLSENDDDRVLVDQPTSVQQPTAPSAPTVVAGISDTPLIEASETRRGDSITPVENVYSGAINTAEMGPPGTREEINHIGAFHDADALIDQNSPDTEINHIGEFRDPDTPIYITRGIRIDLIK